MYKLGQKIKENRKRIGLTLDELAKKTSSSKSYIWELENRENFKPSAEKLFVIAQVLGVTVEYLMDVSREFLTEGEVDNVFKIKLSNLDPDKRKMLEKFINAIS